jgi:hypothetical protein
MTVTFVYDDDEDILTPDEDLEPDQLIAIAAIRTVPDPASRRALMILFVLTVLHGRVGR